MPELGRIRRKLLVVELAVKRVELISGQSSQKVLENNRDTAFIHIMSQCSDGTPGFGSEESSSLWFLEELNRNEDPSRWMPDL